MIFFIFQQIKLCLNKGLQKYNKLMNIYRKKYTICRNFYDLFRYSFKVVFSPNNTTVP